MNRKLKKLKLLIKSVWNQVINKSKEKQLKSKWMHKQI